MERESKLSRAKGLAGKYETAIDSTVVLSSVLWITKLNGLMGVGNDLNPVTVGEIGVLGVVSSACAAAIHMKEKPSKMLKSSAYVISLAFRPEERRRVKTETEEFYRKQQEELDNLGKKTS